MSGTNKISSFVLFAFLAALSGRDASAGPDFSIQTYQQWSDAIGPLGSVTPITSWAEGGLEDIYPGQSAYFQKPTLTAVPDTGGVPALQLNFGTGTGAPVIGGIIYTYGQGDPNDTGATISFSIKETDPTYPGTYAITLISFVNGVQGKDIFSGNIPPQSGQGGFEQVSINLANTSGMIVGPFDITHVSQIRVTYRDQSGSPTSPVEAYIDHLAVTVPEPPSAVLCGLGAICTCYLARYARRSMSSKPI